MREYELIMVLSPEVDEAGVTSVVDRVTQFITQRGGSVTGQETWGLRKLAYPIQKFTEGNYIFTDFSFEPSSTKELDTSIKVSSEVIRHLLVKKETAHQEVSNQ